jgi:hypothetical protein
MGDEEVNNVDNIEEILKQIDKLQVRERAIINDLEIESSRAGFRPDDPTILKLLADINTISETREALFNSVVGKLSILQNGVSESRVDLVSQLTLLKVVEDQLNKVKSQMSSLQNRNDTKMRLVQINTYYGKRYEYQTQLMKKIIIVCIPLIVLFVLKKKGLIPELISNYLLGITIVIGSIYVIRDIWEIHTRSNMNFDEYDWKYEDPSNHAPSIWEYNKKNLLKIENPFKNLLKNLGICVGDDCCSDGLFFDKKKQKCVVPSDMNSTNSEPFVVAEGYNGMNGLNASTISKVNSDEEKDSNGVSPYGPVYNYANVK